jgi:hypothetical protein
MTSFVGIGLLYLHITLTCNLHNLREKITLVLVEMCVLGSSYEWDQKMVRAAAQDMISYHCSVHLYLHPGSNIFLCWRRAPQQMLWTHRSFEAYCVTL